MPKANMEWAISRAIANKIANINTCLPAKIESYNFEEQKASVKPLIKKIYKDGLEVELPVILEVPVVWPRANTAILHFPLKPGDYVMLLFCQRALDRFLNLGTDTRPGDTRKYDLTDAIALPGLMPFTEDPIALNNDDVLLKYNDTSLTIEPSGNMIIAISENLTINIDESSEISIKGDSSISIEGNSNVSIVGNSVVDIEGSSTLNIDNNANIQINGNVDMNVTGSASIKASSVSIDGNTDITGSFSNTGTVSLAGGGPAIARVGDAVLVDPNTGIGQITSGSGSSTSG